MKAKLTLAKGGIVAWMGGSRPKPITECSADEVALVSLLFREQFKTWHDYWKDYPSRDVARIVAAATANARNYHLSGPKRLAAHAALRLANRLAPRAAFERFAWVYDHDPTA